jgi:hypothetical protein
VLFTIVACSNNTEDVIDADPLPNPIILSDEVEVYNKDLLHNNLVLAIESSGQTAYLINKEGKKLFTWVFEDLLGNDFELLSN